MKILVTQEDIAGAKANCSDNPISRALERHTGRRWYVYHSGAVSEVERPYRTKFLDSSTYSAWSAYQKYGHMPPLEFDLEIRDVELPALEIDARLPILENREKSQ